MNSNYGFLIVCDSVVSNNRCPNCDGNYKSYVWSIIRNKLEAYCESCDTVVDLQPPNRDLRIESLAVSLRKLKYRIDNLCVLLSVMAVISFVGLIIWLIV